MQFIVVVIGVFSVSEILLMLEQHHSSAGMIKETGRTLFNWLELKFSWWPTLRSSVVGFVVGVLPGAGATIASAMTYSMEKRLAGDGGTFGDGDIRGVAAPEAANNASAAGSFVPMLTLGVPGSGTTAVMVGALSLYNITPGPALFTQQPALVWGLIASLFIGNLMLLFINIPLVGVFTKVLQVPNWLLVPGILAISTVGVYAVHATTFDLVLMSVLGIVAYFLRKQNVPMAPLILGFVLGDLMEQNLRRALSITNGELGILVESPISMGLWVGVVLMLVVPASLRWWSARQARSAF
jgi:putative tricarboxylic transport membrane protein